MAETLSGADDSLSAQARCVWAKSGNRAREWLPLTQHMVDSRAMAERLFDQWLAPGVRERWGRTFPDGQADARRLFRFLAAAHDVGKAAPVFVAQVETFAVRVRMQGLPCDDMDLLRNHRKVLPHATVSFIALERWLRDKGASSVLSRQLASLVGAHHGRPVKGHLNDLKARGRALGGQPWGDVRQELLEWLDSDEGISGRLAAWEALAIPMPTLVPMCGLVIMADWLASNQDYFPLRLADDDLSPELPANDLCHTRWEAGWAEMAMPWAWAPDLPELNDVDLYRARFGWQEHTPRPLQREVMHLVRDQPVGLMCLESDMGSGKTEAAFVAAEILAAKWGAQGIFIALPTQATTDGMFSRMLPWLDNLPQPPEDVPAWAMTLAHAKSAQNKEFSAEEAAFDDFAREESRTGGTEGIHDEDESGSKCLTNAVAHQWFRGRKRRLLANFGIGTIDQLLMAGLQQKHLMLRHLAFSGKVVVIDECHASDDYMNIYLDKVLAWLGLYGVPVILLSATLTDERRQAMLTAYAPAAEPDAAPEGYPRITWLDTDSNQVRSLVVESGSNGRRIQWQWIDDNDERLAELLERELESGGCALVVRNTVKEAQRIADVLRARGIAPVTLAHSRYLSADRAGNDAELRHRYGPHAGLGVRPERSIVVATQVVEQSLDIDFDLLITDLAPMDLLFQRLGRMHRHHWRVRPKGLREAMAYLIADRSGVLATGTSGTVFIYGEHHLLRTGAVLEQHGHTLKLPNDIAPLVQQALGSGDLDVEPDHQSVLAIAADAHAGKVAARQASAQVMALDDWDLEGDAEAHLGDWLQLPTDPSEALLGAMVRDARPSLEVIVVPLSADGTHAMVPPWMDDGGVLDTSSLPDDATAHRIGTWTVKLPPLLAPGGSQLIALVDEIDNGVAKNWALSRHRLLKGQPILPMQQIHEGSNILETTLRAGRKTSTRLRYSPDRGLEVMADELQSD